MLKHILNILNFIFSFFVLEILHSQDTVNNLYFISSNSEDISMLEYSREDPVWDDTRILFNCIWKLNNDTLMLIDTLNFNPKNNTHLLYLMHQDYDNCIIIKERDRDNWQYLDAHPSESDENENYISIFRYGSDTLEVLKINIKNLPTKFSLFGLNCYFFNGNILFFIGSDYKIPEYDYFITKNGDFIHEKRIWDINSLFVKTESSAMIRFFQTNRYPGGKNGRLKSGHTEDFDSWEDADFQVPSMPGDMEKYRGFSVLYNTPDARYIIGKKDLKEANLSDSLITYWYYDKSNSLWDTFQLHHSYLNFNVYNESYMFGTGISDLRFSNNSDTISKLLFENAKMYSDSLGLIPLIQNLTGKFFIYHIPSKTYCEFVGKTPDTEVIQIIDGWIYYREYDEIRRMKLNNFSNQYSLSDSELVVKDKYRVPMIHHLFLSKAFPKVKKQELFFRKFE